MDVMEQVALALVCGMIFYFSCRIERQWRRR
jgi:hypothetical protein